MASSKRNSLEPSPSVDPSDEFLEEVEEVPLQMRPRCTCYETSISSSDDSDATAEETVPLETVDRTQLSSGKKFNPDLYYADESIFSSCNFPLTFPYAVTIDVWMIFTFLLVMKFLLRARMIGYITVLRGFGSGFLVGLFVMAFGSLYTRLF